MSKLEPINPKIVRRAAFDKAASPMGIRPIKVSVEFTLDDNGQPEGVATFPDGSTCPIVNGVFNEGSTDAARACSTAFRIRYPVTNSEEGRKHVGIDVLGWIYVGYADV